MPSFGTPSVRAPSGRDGEPARQHPRSQREREALRAAGTADCRAARRQRRPPSRQGETRSAVVAATRLAAAPWLARGGARAAGEGAGLRAAAELVRRAGQARLLPRLLPRRRCGDPGAGTRDAALRRATLPGEAFRRTGRAAALDLEQDRVALAAAG